MRSALDLTAPPERTFVLVSEGGIQRAKVERRRLPESAKMVLLLHRNMKTIKEKIRSFFFEPKVPLDDEPFLTAEEIRQTKESEEDFANGNYEELKNIVW